MTKEIGPSFGDEIHAAGLAGLPFSWSSAGSLHYAESMTADQRTAVQAVYDAHDPKSFTRAQINTERDRRVALGFALAGKVYQAGPEDIANINGAVSWASLADAAGAQPGDLRWHGGASDFVWIALDNSLNPMDAQTVITFGKAAAAWKSAHIFAARAIKEASPPPADYTDDALWPARATGK